MTAVEDPVTTLVRLLQANLRVVKDDGGLASIVVSSQWCDRELFKNHDGQVTVGLDRSEDEKIGFSGTARRRVGYFLVNVWAIDKEGVGITGRKMRDRMRAEVNRVIREKRTKPNETVCNYVGVGQGTGTHKAYYARSSSELAPSSTSWTELSNFEYEKLWYSDNLRFWKSNNVAGEYMLMLFRFKVDSDNRSVKSAVLKFEGYGTAFGGNGATIKAWNHVAAEWQNAQAGTGGTDEVITITLSSNLTDSVDSNGYVYLLARTTYTAVPGTPAVLYCDYSECPITVDGILYCDIVSYRDQDQVNIKPFIWRTAFTVKSWLFENVPET